MTIERVGIISLAILLISMAKLYIKYSAIGMRKFSLERIKQRNVYGDKVEALNEKNLEDI